MKGKNGEIIDTSEHQNINHILYRPAPIWEIMDADNPYYAASNRNPVWADVKLKTITETYNEMNISKKIKNQSLFFRNGLFEYNLYKNSIVSISIYDIFGRLVKHVLNQKYQSAGIHAISMIIFTCLMDSINTFCIQIIKSIAYKYHS